MSDYGKWQPVRGFGGKYEVSSRGFVRRIGGGMMGLMKHASGYVFVRLSNRDERKTERVHRLVAEAFLPNPDRLPCVNHIDFDKANNDVSNLEWCTQTYNLQHSHKAGRMFRHPIGTISPTRVLSSEAADKIAIEYRSGIGSMSALAVKHGISKKTVLRAVQGKYSLPPSRTEGE